MESLLWLLLAIPVAGAAVGALMRDAKAARAWAMAVSLATLAIGGVLLAGHLAGGGPSPAASAAAANGEANLIYAYTPDVESYLAVPSLGFQFALGLDGVGLWLVVLTVFLQPLALLFSFGSIRERQTEYYAWLSALLAAMLGVFLARDALLFYIFFELTLIPMFFIIGIWGGPERRYAAGKFFLFTFAGSVFTLAALIYLGINSGHGQVPSFLIADIVRYAQGGLSDTARLWVALGFLAGFAVKVPLFPVHTWLPLAHTEAPTAGSVILAGVLLKLGTYGLLRLAIPIGFVTAAGGVAFPGLVTAIGVLCLIGIIYGALVAWVQQDIKKLVAYSSVSHLGFCVLGLFAFNDVGMQGSVLYMINHGLSTGAMFLVIGMIYDRYHTRDINELSGLARVMPRLAFFFVLFVLSSVGLPGLNGFVSEFLTILGAFTSSHLGVGFGVVAAVGIILGAVYMLHMTAKVIFGPLKVPGGGDHGHEAGTGGAAGHGGLDPHDQPASHPHLPTDIGGREIAVLVPLALAVVLLGVLPNVVLDGLRDPVRSVRQPIAATAATAVTATPVVHVPAANMPAADRP